VQSRTGSRTILVVSPIAEDHACLSVILKRRGCEVRSARTYREALAMLDEEEIFLVVSERTLPDGNWRDILDRTAAARRGPCLIVTSAVADDRLWAEVLNLGGYDVLAKPFSAEEVVRVAELAYLHWSHGRRRPHPAALVSGGLG
jgi:DNA-binding NtrC family response regulator